MIDKEKKYLTIGEFITEASTLCGIDFTRADIERLIRSKMIKTYHKGMSPRRMIPIEELDKDKLLVLSN